MKNLQLFEDFISDELDKIFNRMKKHKIGDIISYETMYDYINSLHDFDLDNEFIEEFIMSNKKYELVELNIKELDLEPVSTHLVSEYELEYKKTNWYPPILFSKSEDMIIDGYHRAQMIYNLGESKISAWTEVS